MEKAVEALSNKRDFFVSYTGRDEKWAKWIAYELEEAGYSTVLQAWDFRSAGNFVLEMHKAIQDCNRTVAVLSDAYERSGFTQAEWAAAFAEDPTGELGKLITVRIEDYEPSGLFRPIVYIDLVDLDQEDAKRALLGEVEKIIAEGRRKPVSPSEFPGAGSSRTADTFPGDLPPIWNLPIQLRQFSGRSLLMAEVAETLETDRVCVLNGLGGVGKTRVALEHAHRSGKRYRLVWRVRASGEATSRGDLADLGEALGLVVSSNDSRDDLVAATMDWLAKNDEWLLVLEDAASPEQVAELIPPGAGGQVLITSQAAAGWSTIATPIEVSMFTAAEADDFLTSRVGPADDEEIRALAAALGELPLALEQAAAYIEATGVGPGVYLQRLREHAPELLSKGIPIDYGETAATTWRLAMEEIADHHCAAQLLESCALLAPDWIPRGLFDGEDLRFDSPEVMPAIELDAAITELRRFSLIGLDDERISVHRLVQWATREALSKEALATRVKELRTLLVESWPDESGREPSEWAACAALAPHLEALAKHSVDIDPDGKAASAANLMAVGIYLRTRGDYHSACGLFERALSLLKGYDEQLEGELLVGLSGEYGLALSMIGDHEKAAENQERALRLVESLGIDRSPGGAAAFSLAGISLCEAGEDSRARQLHERALEIFRAESPPSVHKIGSALGNLGNMARRSGDLRAARTFQVESIELLEAEHGPNHHEVGIALGGLARVERAANNMKTALNLLSRALEIFETELGPGSPAVGRACHDRCSVNAELGNFEAARADIERALDIYCNTGDPRDPRLLQPLGDLTRLCIELGDEPGAKAAASKAYAITH